MTMDPGPILISLTLPTNQANHFPTKGNARTSAFHPIDPFLKDFSCFLIQSYIPYGQYLDIKNFPYKESGFFISRHNFLATKD